MESQVIIIFQLVVFIFSVMIHEISHGAIALRLGDSTAKDAGRLTLNPLKHIDLFGSILLPLFLVLVNSPFLFGWAKPVPYNPLRLRDPKRGAGIIAAAGPLSNLLVAAFFAVAYRFISALENAPAFGTLGILMGSIVAVNIVLAVFNLIPIPPLDGSGVLFSVLPNRFYPVEEFLSRFGMYILLFLMFSGSLDIIRPIAQVLYNFFLGVPISF